MSTDYNEFQAEQDAIEDALDAARQDPFAGEDPDDNYLEAEAERRMVWHEEQEHAGDPCDCRTAHAASGEAPF